MATIAGRGRGFSRARRAASCLSGAALMVTVLQVALVAPVNAVPARTISTPARAAGGDVSPVTQIRGLVALRLRHHDEFDALVRRVERGGVRPGHPLLGRGAFLRRFAPTAATVAAVATSLRREGLTVGTVAANRFLLPVTGTASAVQRAFSFALHTTATPHGLIVANETPPVVPVALTSLVAGITIDDSAVRAAPAIVDTPRTAHTVLRPTIPKACALAVNGSANAIALATTYNMSAIPTSGSLGAGQTIAVQEVAQYSPSDVATFDACYGISPVLQVENSPLGGADALGGNSQTEATSDIEVVQELVPGATLIDYASPNTTAGILSSFNQFVADDAASVISTSWSFCENTLTSNPSFTQSENTVFEAAALQGQTVLAASGDFGSTCGGTSGGVNIISDPSSQPFVTAVGGTTLSAYVSPPNETAWSGSGGGNSKLWVAPCYQAAALGSSVACTPVNASTSTSTYLGLNGFRRATPDVAALAGSPGYTIYDTPHCLGWCGTTTGIGGTSLSTPLWASIVLAAVQHCGAVGFINPTLYAQRTAGMTNDVTSGSNGTYSAAVGWDRVTGVGSPNADKIVTALCGAPVSAAGGGAMTASPSTVTAGSSTNFTFTYTAPSTGVTDGTLSVVVPSGWTAPTTGSGAGMVATSVGTLTVTDRTIAVTDLNLAPNATVTITFGTTAQPVTVPATAGLWVFVAAESPGNVAPVELAANPTVLVRALGTTTTLTAAPTAAMSGTTVTLTATVTPSAASGTVAFAVGGTAIPGCGASTVVAGVATCSTGGLAVGTDTVTATYSGDGTYGSSLATTTVSVTPAPVATTTALLAVPTVVTIGQQATLTATIAPGDATGTVAFTNGASTIVGCAAVAVTAGSASCATTTLGLGANVITATYGGDGGHLASSTTITVSVLPPPVATTTVVSTSKSAVAVGASVTFTATVTPAGATGTVSFAEGATAISGCDNVALISGTATCASSTLAVGPHTISATYHGDAGHLSSQGSHAITVTLRSSAVTVHVPSTTIVYGATTAVTATVSAADLTAPGTVTFTIGGAPLCTAAVSTTKVATCTVTWSAIGPLKLGATYSGGGTVAGSTAAPLTLTLVREPATIQLSATTTKSGSVTTVVVVAKVRPSDGGGTVAFVKGTTPLAGCSAVALSTAGIAQCRTSISSKGMITFTARYSGSVHVAPAHTSVVTSIH
jgi:subtilase family serine protease